EPAGRLRAQIKVLAPDGLGAHRVVHGPAALNRAKRQPALPQQPIGPDQAQVPGGNRRADAELLRVSTPTGASVPSGEGPVHGRAATPSLGSIHHVVVYQGAGMQ